MIESQETPDPRKVLLQEISAKVPDPVPDIHAYGWAKLELLGHRVIYGYLDQVEFCGGRVLRMRQPVQQPGSPPDAELQLVEVGRYGVPAMYGCAPMTKLQVLGNLDWVRDQLTELWHATRALPPASIPPEEPAEPCLMCGAPAGAACKPDCGNLELDDDDGDDDDSAAAPTSSDGDLP